MLCSHHGMVWLCQRYMLHICGNFFVFDQSFPLSLEKSKFQIQNEKCNNQQDFESNLENRYFELKYRFFLFL